MVLYFKILARRKTGINQRKETNMIALPIAAVAIWIGAMNVGFNQAKTNPDANNIFEAKSHIVQDASSID